MNEIADFGVKAQSLKPQFPSMTFPNHYSIITGLYPANHGIIANHFKNPIDDTDFGIINSTTFTESHSEAITAQMGTL